MIRRLREGKNPTIAKSYVDTLKSTLDYINDLTKEYSGNSFDGYLQGTKLRTALQVLYNDDRLTDEDENEIRYMIDQIIDALNSLTKQIGNCNRKLDKNIGRLGEICDKYRDEEF